MELMNIVRHEYEATVSGLRTKRAIKTLTSSKIVADSTPGDEILVYRENKGWDRPLTFPYGDSRLSVVLDSKRFERLFHKTMLKPYTGSYLSAKDLLNSLDNADNASRSELIANRVEPVHDKTGKRFNENRLKEHDGIVTKGGVEVVNRSDLPENASFFETRYVLTNKSPNTIKDRFKAGWLLHEHHEKL